MKHTSGPWKIRTGGTMTGRGPEVYAEGAYYDDGSELVVADCGTAEHRPGGSGRWKKMPENDECYANARLIAAAPDLLNALTLCQHALLGCHDSSEDDNPIQSAIGGALEAAGAAIAKAEGRL